DMVVDPIRVTRAIPCARQVSTNPHSGIGKIVGGTSLRTWIVLINRRSPINRNSTDDESQKKGNIQPMADSNEHVMFPDYTHARRWRRRACSEPLLMELSGT